MNTDDIRKKIKRHEFIPKSQLLFLCDEVDRLNRKLGIMQYLQVQIHQLLQVCSKKSKLRRAA